MRHDDDDDRYSVDQRELERMRRRDRRRHTDMIIDNGDVRDIAQAIVRKRLRRREW